MKKIIKIMEIMNQIKIPKLNQMHDKKHQKNTILNRIPQ